MEEEWRDVVGYDGKYSVSNNGVVLSNYRFNFGRKIENKIFLKPQINPQGYYMNVLYNGNPPHKHHTVHRLVATAFIPNPNNLPCINHLDGNKINNAVDNLEWCSYSRNNKHAYDIGLKTASNTEKFGSNSRWSKVVYQLTIDGTFIREWDSLATVEKETGFWKSQICQCANFEKHFLSSNGYRWIYKEDFEKLFDINL